MNLDQLNLEWITDTHFNRYSNRDIDSFAHSLRGTCDGVVISGDISEGASFFKDLLNFQRGCGLPIYFVLGNHDFWGHSILERRREVHEFTKRHRYFNYLTLSDVFLINGVSLTGHDGIYAPIDECVDYSTCNDFSHIKDLIGRNRIKNLVSLNDIYKGEYIKKLEEAGRKSDTIMFFTHMPPYLWACSGLNNHFVYNPVLGACITDYLALNPSKNIQVYSGHTHKRFSWKEGNLVVQVGQKSQNRSHRLSL